MLIDVLPVDDAVPDVSFNGGQPAQQGGPLSNFLFLCLLGNSSPGGAIE